MNWRACEPRAGDLRVRDLLARARAAGVDRLDAQLLLARLVQQPRTWLIAHDDAVVNANVADRFGAQIAERVRGVPIAYLIGSREFHGLELHVTPDVLVPRPDTEVLVDWALSLLPRHEPVDAVDLGTGSGAIALAIKCKRPRVRMVAVDTSLAALEVARANAQGLKLYVEFVFGDWFLPLAGRKFHFVLGNPPYIDAADPHMASLHAEPRVALTPGADGLSALRTITALAPEHLWPGAWLMLEHGHDQGPAVRALLQSHGFAKISTRIDLGGRERVTAGQRGCAQSAHTHGPIKA